VKQRKKQKKLEKEIKEENFRRSEDPTEEGVFGCPRLANLFSFSAKEE